MPAQAWQDAGDVWLIGPMARAPLPQHLLDRHMPQIAIDGGGQAASAPHIWLGDGDSGFPPPGVEAHLKPTQDKTDIEFALEFLHGGAWSRLHLSGFWGGRAGHALANIGAVVAGMKTRPRFEQAVFYDNSGALVQRIFAAGALSFRHDGLFSLFTLADGVVSISGACEYPVHRMRLPALSGRGVSNVASGEVRVEADLPVIVVFEQDA